MNDPDRDRALERLLRQPGIHAGLGPGDDCLDAEALAAWMDGELDPSAAALVESHMASCARCQALVATMARAESGEGADDSAGTAGAAPWWRARFRWMVPVAAGVTAGLLWTVIPDQQAPSTIAEQQATAVVPPRPEPSNEPQAEAPRAQGFAVPAPEVAPERERQGAPPDLRRSAQAKAEPPPAADTAAAPTVKAARPPAPPPAPMAAPEAAAATPDAAGRRAEFFSTQIPLEVPSPDAAVRWRVGASAIERTTDGGATWTPSPIDPPVLIVAGSSPSTEVCWLAGRDGAVLLTTDGSTWRRVTAPAPGDLVFVEATDYAHAVVRSADGRTFRTVDGGETWTAEP